MTMTVLSPSFYAFYLYAFLCLVFKLAQLEECMLILLSRVA